MVYKKIIIANIAEAFEGILMSVKSRDERTKRIMAEHSLCDRALLWEGDNKVVVTPFPISPLILERNLKALGFKNCLNFFPEVVDISLSESIIKDKYLFEKLAGIIRGNPGIRISPYAVTQSFINLIRNLKTICK